MKPKMFLDLAYWWRWQFYDLDFIISASDAMFVIYYSHAISAMNHFKEHKKRVKNTMYYKAIH